jgi:hypothetical protein
VAGWLVIDLDGTLITARSDKEAAAATFKTGYGFHPLGAWCADTAESLANAAAAGQRRIEHLRRPPHRADRRDPADPGPDAVAAAGPRRPGAAPAASWSATCCRWRPGAAPC